MFLTRGCDWPDGPKNLMRCNVAAENNGARNKWRPPPALMRCNSSDTKGNYPIPRDNSHAPQPATGPPSRARSAGESRPAACQGFYFDIAR
jgi:hypothetical protein